MRNTHSLLLVGLGLLTACQLTAGAGPHQKPTDLVAEFTATPLRGPAPLRVSFDAGGSVGAFGYNWVFGDGDAAPTGSVAPQHTYAQPGRYTVSLVVTSKNGESSAPASVQVEALPAGGTVAAGDPTPQLQPPPQPGERVEVKPFFVGNSHTDSIRLQGDSTTPHRPLPANVRAAGKRMNTLGRYGIPGAPLSYIWSHRTQPRGIFVKDGQARTQLAFTQALALVKPDALILQPYDRGLDSDVLHAGKMLDAALKVNPQVQLYIYTYFPRMERGSWEDQYNAGTKQNTSRAYFETLARKISKAHPNAKPVLLIPTSEVFMRLKQKIDAHQVPGLESVQDLYVKWSSKNAKGNGHVNAIGSYVLATTVYATLYKADPRRFPLGVYAKPGDVNGGNPRGVSEAVAKIVRETVYETLQNNAGAGVQLR